LTTFFPDISSFQGNIALTGAPAVAIKVTEGTSWTSGYWQAQVTRAKAAGAVICLYHFLHQGNAAGQAAFCHGRAGNTPLMLDWEPTGSSRPSPADAQQFIDAYRASGGTCNLLYFPRWYHGQIGQPNLGAFIKRGMALWSSSYTSYTDSPDGAGWLPYGGMAPKIWQFTDRHAFGGQLVDFNAAKMSLDAFRQLVTGGAPPPGPPADGAEPVIRQGDSGPAVTKAQGRLNTHGAAPSLTVDAQFGPRTDKEARDFQAAQHLTVDGVIGPDTWTRLNRAAAPVPPRPAPPAAAGDGKWHGSYLTAGMFSLRDLAAKLGYPPNTVIRMTATHYGSLGTTFGDHVGKVFRGEIPWDTPVPAGCALWLD
jgi:GH25 family lysozyme M1 (1,4-beta-N-acetylmuramidase)